MRQMTHLRAWLTTVTLVGCTLVIGVAVLAGRKGAGLNAGYQVDGRPCSTIWVDSTRPKADFAVNTTRPSCLYAAAWSSNRRFAALIDGGRNSLRLATGRIGTTWHHIIALEDVHAAPRSLSWSPDSTQLAFFTPATEVTVVGVLPLANGIPGQPDYFTVEDTQPIPLSSLTWSPDGRYLAFAAYDAPRRFGSEELYLLDVTTGAARRLTDNQYHDDSPSWSPDGGQLVFVSGADGYNELYILDLATGKRRRLTFYTFGFLPTWSPDGKTIAFTSNRDFGFDLYVIGANGFGLRRLTFEHYASIIYPMWLS